MSWRHKNGEPDGNELELGRTVRLCILQANFFARRQPGRLLLFL